MTVVKDYLERGRLVMLKRSLAVLLCLVLFTSSAVANSEMVSGSKYKKEGPYVIGFANVWVGNTWGVQSVAELEAEALRHEDIKDLYITDAQNNAAKQISDVEDLLARGIDLLIIQAISPEGIVPTIEKVTAADIPVIASVSPLATDQYAASVAALDEDFGRVGAEWLVEKLGGKGRIIILDGMAGISVAELRLKGAMSVFDQYPDIKIVGHEYADWDYAKGKMAAENLLAANPVIDGVWSSGGDMTRGAIEAFVASRRPLVPMTGEDNNGFLKLWKKYQPEGFEAIGASMPTYLHAEALRIGLELLRGNDVPRDTIIPVPTITDENIDEYVKFDLPDSFWTNTRMDEDDIAAFYAD